MWEKFLPTSLQLQTAAEVLSAVFVFLAGWIILANWACVFLSYFGKKHYSTIPLIGGIFGCIGCLLSPFETLNEFWWVPLVADIATIPLLICTLVFLLTYWLRNR